MSLDKSVPIRGDGSKRKPAATPATPQTYEWTVVSYRVSPHFALRRSEHRLGECYMRSARKIPFPPPVHGRVTTCSPSRHTHSPWRSSMKNPFSGPKSSKAMRTIACGSSEVASPPDTCFHPAPSTCLSLNKHHARSKLSLSDNEWHLLPTAVST